MKTGKLFLTSTGLSSENVAKKFQSFFTDPAKERVAMVTTAAEGKEKNEFSQLAKNQLTSIGFVNIDFVDLEIDLSKDFSQYTVIYVCGGNTFKLLYFARQANFKKTIEELLNRNGVYVGVSAGSIIVGPSIDIANEVDPDPNDIGLKDLTGLGITSYIISPHYSPEVEDEIKKFEQKYNVTVERVDNSQAVLIDNENKFVIE